MKESEVTVVIPVYHKENRDRVRRATGSLLENTHSPKEIILVVNGGSEDGDALRGAREFEKENKGVRVLYTSQKGVINARNLGLNEVRTKYVVFCDVDSEPDRNWIESLVRSVKTQEEENHKTLLVSGPIVFSDKSDQENKSFRKKQAILIKALSVVTNTGKKRSAFITEGGFIACTERLHEIGGFNPELEGCFGEGAELAARAIRAGWHIYYDPSVELRTSPRRIRRITNEFFHAFILLSAYIGHASSERFRICLEFRPTNEE